MVLRQIERYWPASLALLALIPITWLALSNADLPQFGKYQDDGLLFIGAKSLGRAEGYRISSLPGKPFQTKYPPLYSALSVPLWSINGRFPANLKLLALGEYGVLLAFLGAAFLLFRSFGFSSGKAAAMFAFLALSPWLMFWALLPVSDILFAALAVASFWVLQKHGARPYWCLLAGLLGGAACLTKVAGILMVPAICCGIRRRGLKNTVAATAPILAACAGWMLWTHFHRVAGDNSVLWYYTDYISFFTKNGGLAALPEIVQSNVLAMMEAVGNSVLYNLTDSIPGRFLSILVLAGGISGARRLVQRAGAWEYPVFCVLLLLLLLVWNFSPNPRLMAPAMPLLAMGLCAEAEHIAALIRRSGQSPKSSDRVAARAIGAALIAACAMSPLLNVNFMMHGIPPILQADRADLTRDRAAFEWCKRALPAGSVVLAINDTYMYLETGLSTVQPMPDSVAFYRNDIEGEIANYTHLDALVDYFGITHILVTPQNFEGFLPVQQKTMRAALFDNPRLRTIYSAGGDSVVEVQGAAKLQSAAMRQAP